MPRIRLSLPVLLLLAGFPVRSPGQSAEPFPASSALQLLISAHGTTDPPPLVEMRATNGQPQPSRWVIFAFDRQSPLYVHAYSARPGRFGDDGDSQSFYPAKFPDGFLDPARIRIDSTTAFQIFSLHAGAASIRFETVDYLLRCRPYDTEPIWRLTGLDRNRRTVAVVDLSGETGVVLRTIWYRWPQRDRGFPEISDSATTGKPPTPIEPPAPPAPVVTVEPVTAPAPSAPSLSAPVMVPPTVPASDPAPVPAPPVPAPPLPMPKAEVGPADPFAETDPVKVIPLPPLNPSSGATPKKP
jgi:hypothetical protein